MEAEVYPNFSHSFFFPKKLNVALIAPQLITGSSYLSSTGCNQKQQQRRQIRQKSKPNKPVPAAYLELGGAPQANKILVLADLLKVVKAGRQGSLDGLETLVNLCRQKADNHPRKSCARGRH